MSNTILPKQFQPALGPTADRESFIVQNPEISPDAVPLDVVFVGAGPGGLLSAIHLARLLKAQKEKDPATPDIQIGVLEKAANLGGHTLSGAVINPRVLREVFPELKDEDFPFRKKVKGDRVYFMTSGTNIRIPTPPPMHNSGNYIASLCEVVRWLGTKAEELGINILTSFPADQLLADANKNIIGVRTVAAGLGRDRQPGSQYMPPTDITARITVLSEGTRGPLTQSYLDWQKINSDEPQIFALGVKEIWKVKKAHEFVTHTLGWPLPLDCFGGSFMYPMADDMVSIGLVAGLDYKKSTLDVHAQLQTLKQHPLVKSVLEGGEIVEWGAKTIPEGGYHAVPKRLYGDGLMMIGDCAGLVNVPALKGIHYAMESGRLAAETIFAALMANDISAKALSPYDEKVRASFIFKDLKKVRNMRQAFKSGFWLGGIKAALMTLTGGLFPGDQHNEHEDASDLKTVVAGDVPKAPNQNPLPGAAVKTLTKLDAVYLSGNKTRDDIPTHLTVGKDIPAHVADMYTAMCPAGVYERKGDQLVVNAPNCIDCKATDVLGPRWQPREGGAGPDYKLM
ncbi:MAG: electron-transfer flavoprotein:ubiquinone oxidoreductase [Bdellovibrionota bacterium]